mgnify:CR=1 FL=1
MNIIFICLFSIFVLPQLPWWAISITASMAGFLSKKYLTAMLNGFICGAIPWSVAFMYKHYSGAEIIMLRVADMIGVQSWIALLLVTAIIGGVVGLLGSVCAYSFKRAFKDQFIQP